MNCLLVPDCAREEECRFLFGCAQVDIRRVVEQLRYHLPERGVTDQQSRV